MFLASVLPAVACLEEDAFAGLVSRAFRMVSLPVTIVPELILVGGSVPEVKYRARNQGERRQEVGE